MAHTNSTRGERSGNARVAETAGPIYLRDCYRDCDCEYREIVGAGYGYAGEVECWPDDSCERCKGSGAVRCEVDGCDRRLSCCECGLYAVGLEAGDVVACCACGHREPIVLTASERAYIAAHAMEVATP